MKGKVIKEIALGIIDIPKEEYRILKAFAQGSCPSKIAEEMNTQYRTVMSVLRRNMSKFLNEE